MSELFFGKKKVTAAPNSNVICYDGGDGPANRHTHNYAHSEGNFSPTNFFSSPDMFEQKKLLAKRNLHLRTFLTEPAVDSTRFCSRKVNLGCSAAALCLTRVNTR